MVLLLITRRFSETITHLKDFAISLRNDEEPDDSALFPQDEMGTISSQITSIYRELNDAREDILVEKNKLYSHLAALNEGVAFFSPERERILANNHFIQNLNLISERSSISAEKIFKLKEMDPIIEFIEKQAEKPLQAGSDDLPRKEIDISKDNRYFNVKCVLFQNGSFEIVITDTTRLEKRRLMKQQMTSNIAHELKTPVATVMGYLETLQANQLTAAKQKYFIDKAHSQAKRLSDLIEGISTLNRIEEEGENFTFEKVNVTEIVRDVKDQLAAAL